MNREEPWQRGMHPPPEVLDRISQAIRGVRFGSVDAVIKNGKVIQIERKDKFRLER